jgi:hypothetical protein
MLTERVGYPDPSLAAGAEASALAAGVEATALAPGVEVTLPPHAARVRATPPIKAARRVVWLRIVHSSSKSSGRQDEPV